jgi:methylated-DNA-[protein]-cysteine S-methyltransferase
MESPIGRIELTASDTHLLRLHLLPPHLGEAVSSPNPVLREAIRQLEEYFAGQRRCFHLPLQQEGTPFRQKVWAELQKIPYGRRISYKELAKRTGNIRAWRAVGSANGKNRLFIVIPCHRVVLADGKLGGFACGRQVKRFLLEMEEKYAAGE